jgi:phosphate transport system ATP-binding protein
MIAPPRPAHTEHGGREHKPLDPLIAVEKLDIYYGDFHAVRGVDMLIGRNEITALIGPSGCGKSTVIRCFDRMNDLIPSARVEGKVLFHGQDLYAKDVDPIEVRRRVGMVFQKPNPFPKSIFDNVAYGPKVVGEKLSKKAMAERVEQALTGAALWDEVKDKLEQNGLSLSGGQQQRLCIARAIATKPEVILMDEPCSALDARGTEAIEALIASLTPTYTVVVVTHNMAQARRVSGQCVFMLLGQVVEQGPTVDMFLRPTQRETELYVEGRYG